jgi:HTH-type transcriptional regulator, transcriptional repressor of NAD biosynthesis genes
MRSSPWCDGARTCGRESSGAVAIGMSTSKLFRRGLVVGKFAPLHAGHELVIRRAQEMCDDVVVISYSKPEFPGCEPERRERWLAELFPQTRRLVLSEKDFAIPSNDADETIHRRFVGELCDRTLGVTVDAVFTSEDYGGGFAAELTRYFREGGAGPEFVVRHVQVDRARDAIPVSGTMIRADVHGHRRWLSPPVYTSFVERVALLGGESTGKSTLAAMLANVFGTRHVAEYGRELWEAKHGALAFEDLRAIAEEQIEREERAMRRDGVNRFIFCDSTPLTTLMYSLEMFGRADPVLEQLAKRSYAHVLLCAGDFPFVQDGTRRDAAFRERQQAWYQSELTRRGISFQVLTGTSEERVAQVKRLLESGRRTWPTEHTEHTEIEA